MQNNIISNASADSCVYKYTFEPLYIFSEDYEDINNIDIFKIKRICNINIDKTKIISSRVNAIYQPIIKDGQIIDKK